MNVANINIVGAAIGLTVYIITSIGFYQLFRKCGSNGLFAFVPGLRYYTLGDASGRDREGTVCLLLEIMLFCIQVVRQFLPPESQSAVLLEMAAIVLALIFIVYRLLVLMGVCETFGRKKWWLIPWMLASYIVAPLWGFSKDFQPVNLGKVADDEILAGTKPWQIGSGVPGSVPKKEEEERVESISEGTIPRDLYYDPSTGLYVNVRERTVSSFFKKRYLLKDIEVEIPRGALVMLLGGSGAGKTTFLNAVTGYEKADATVRLGGEDVYENYKEMKYRVGFVPQQDLMRTSDTVAFTLNDAAKLRLPLDVTWKERKEKMDSVMGTLGLTAGKNGLVAKKSGGQKKRISIGMELIADPELFILDEPDSGLDGGLARELFEKLRTIADEGRIVIAITHTPDRVVHYFDRVIVLARDSGRVGRLAFYGSPDEAREFFGKSTMEEIVMTINRKGEGGEGRADEFIEKFARQRTERQQAETRALEEALDGLREGEKA